jgi:hypothetical protein
MSNRHVCANPWAIGMTVKELILFLLETHFQEEEKKENELLFSRLHRPLTFTRNIHYNNRQDCHYHSCKKKKKIEEKKMERVNALKTKEYGRPFSFSVLFRKHINKNSSSLAVHQVEEIDYTTVSILADYFSI